MYIRHIYYDTPEIYRHAEIIAFTEIYIVQKFWSVIVHVQIIFLKDFSTSVRVSTKKRWVSVQALDFL